MFSSKVLGMKILRINKTPGIPMDCGVGPKHLPRERRIPEYYRVASAALRPF